MRLFARHIGMPPHIYMTHVRLRVARQCYCKVSRPHQWRQRWATSTRVISTNAFELRMVSLPGSSQRRSRSSTAWVFGVRPLLYVPTYAFAPPGARPLVGSPHRFVIFTIVADLFVRNRPAMQRVAGPDVADGPGGDILAVTARVTLTETAGTARRASSKLPAFAR